MYIQSGTKNGPFFNQKRGSLSENSRNFSLNCKIGQLPRNIGEKIFRFLVTDFCLTELEILRQIQRCYFHYCTAAFTVWKFLITVFDRVLQFSFNSYDFPNFCDSLIWTQHCIEQPCYRLCHVLWVQSSTSFWSQLLISSLAENLVLTGKYFFLKKKYRLMVHH